MRYNLQSKSRRKWLIVSVVPLIAFLVAGITMNTSPPTHSAQTASDALDELKTRVYAQSMDQVFAAAQSVAKAQKTWFKAWRVVDKAQVTIGPKQRQLDVEVPVLFFTDDLTVNIGSDSNGKTTINVESRSRVGQGDFGENRRHIAQFLRALDEKLNTQ